MLPDDDSYQQTQKLRSKEILIGLLLAFCALGSTVLYIVVLKEINLLAKIAIIAFEWLVMIFVFLIIVSKMRRRGR